MSKTKTSRPQAKFLSVLVYLDEPQLILLSPTTNIGKVLALAIPDSSCESRYLAVMISDALWDRYIQEFVDLRYVFENPINKRWFLFDGTDHNSNFVELHSVAKSDMRIWNNLPKPGFFSRDHTERLPEELIASAIQSYLIDGAWGAADFSRFNGILDDLYSFVVTLVDFDSRDAFYKLKQSISQAFINYPMKGGTSYVHFYDDLEKAYPPNDRLRLAKVQYASPGQIDFRGRPEVFSDLNLFLLTYGKNRIAAKEKLKNLYSYLRKAKLLRLPVSEFDKASAMSPQILALVKELARAIGFEHIEMIHGLSDSNSLATAKIFGSFVRRIERAYQFFAEGRVAHSTLTESPENSASQYNDY